MVQRSPTCVITSKTADLGIFSVAFNESKTIEDADLVNQSMPYNLVLKFAAGGVTARLKKLDEELFNGLKEKGFQLTWELQPGGGEVGLLGFLFDRIASGSCKYASGSTFNTLIVQLIVIDFGCCQSIIDGKIGVKPAGIDHFEQDGVVFTDGTRQDADIVVLAYVFW